MHQVNGVMAQGTALRLPFPDNFFHCIMTSPPYWGMREYAGETQRQAWGGDPDCDHLWIEDSRKVQTGGMSKKQMSNAGVEGSGWLTESTLCYKCGLWIGELGMEPTPEMFIDHIVEVCREGRRVLRPEGVFWLNMGDGHYNYRPGGSGIPKQSVSDIDRDEPTEFAPHRGNEQKDLRDGSLMLIPHRMARALALDGWIVRQDLVWSKPNPMVESNKGWRWEKHRLKIESADVDWKSEARRTERAVDGPNYVSGGNTGTKGYRPKWKPCPGCDECSPNGGYIFRKGSWRHTSAHEFIFQLATDMKYFTDRSLVLEEVSETSHGALEPGAGQKQADLGQNQGTSTTGVKTEMRNPRSVLHFPSSRYKGAHYATYPPDLIMPLIRAGCPTKVCSKCGDPWAPVMDLDHNNMPNVKIDYRRTCSHRSSPASAGWVLDPFFGSGTTGVVAKMVGVNFAGIDISYNYLSENARVRAFGQTPPRALDDLPLFQTATDQE